MKAIKLHMQRIYRFAPLASRIAAALFGGYALAALSSVAVLAIPSSKPQAVLSGMMLSFIVYAGAVIWVFAARSAPRAWGGLLLAAFPLLLASCWVWFGAEAA
ncbi:DUF3649 domain-containing protein [Paracandidimonas soli]|nr:DUF3649 domain-containing protein [Paracandidimonas soli]